MKTTKRVIAVVMAVLMLALAVPFAASAATSYSLTINCDKDDYTYTVYKIASLNETTGAYENFATDDIEAAIKQSTDSTADVLTAANAATLTNSIAAITFTGSKDSETLNNLGAGMYYIKCTAKSINNTAITQNNIVPLPNTDMAAGSTTYTVDVATNKIKEGDEPTVEKFFSINSNLTKSPQTFGSDDTITYVLTATVPGSYTNQLTQYIITDKMGTGLDTNTYNITSVVLMNGNTKVSDLGYDVTTTASEIGDATFGVKIKANELTKEAFYNNEDTDAKKVVVTFTTKLAANAPINTDIPNTDALKYTNAGGSNTVPGDTVKAKTYKIQALKLDAQSNAKLAGATFTLYKADGTTVITTATSVAGTGIADFNKLLPAGTYVVVETDAPEGYMKNTTPTTIILGDGPDDDLVTVTVKDTKKKTPDTGGAGTMMFTIIGGSLIVLAGVLFVVVMKKRKSSK